MHNNSTVKDRGSQEKDPLTCLRCASQGSEGSLCDGWRPHCGPCDKVLGDKRGCKYPAPLAFVPPLKFRQNVESIRTSLGAFQFVTTVRRAVEAVNGLSKAFSRLNALSTFSATCYPRQWSEACQDSQVAQGLNSFVQSFNDVVYWAQRGYLQVTEGYNGDLGSKIEEVRQAIKRIKRRQSYEYECEKTQNSGD